MPNPTPEALVAAHAAYDEARESGCHERDAMEAAVEAALAASKAEAAGGEAVDLIPWLYVIRSEFLPDDASLGRESDRKMREALDWATNAMRDRAALSQQPEARGVVDGVIDYHEFVPQEIYEAAQMIERFMSKKVNTPWAIAGIQSRDLTEARNVR